MPYDRDADAPSDQTLQCIDCKQDFLFSGGEQLFYSDKGLTPPKRCAGCREKKKARRAGDQQRQFQSKSQQRRVEAQTDTENGLDA